MPMEYPVPDPLDVEQLSYGLRRQVKTGASALDIQSEIDYVSNNVEEGMLGVVEGQMGETVILNQSLVLPSNVVLKNMKLKVADGTNITAIKSENFDSLVNSNSWFVDTSNINYNFGLENVHIDGNKANNTSSNSTDADGADVGGIAFYGKRYFVDKVFVRDTVGHGFYSEAGDVVGQHDWRDPPEASIRNLWVRESGLTGIKYYGPHDGHIHTAFPLNSGQRNLWNGVSSNKYNGNLTIDVIHAYSSSDSSIYCAAKLKGNWIETENAGADGIRIDSYSGGVTISTLYTYGNTNYGLNVSGSDNVHILGGYSKGNGGDGVMMWNALNCSISNMDIKDNTGKGIVFGGTSDNNLYCNNHLMNNTAPYENVPGANSLLFANKPRYYDLDEVLTGIAGGGSALSSAISRASLGDDIEVNVVPNADPGNDVAFEPRVFWDSSAGALKVKVVETAAAGGGDAHVYAKKVG